MKVKKSYLCFACLALCMMLTTTAASAQGLGSLPQEMIIAVMNEPPLTENDVKQFIVLAEDFNKLEMPNQYGPAYAEVFKTHGLSENRGFYIITKVAMIYSSLEYGSDLTQMSGSLKPNATEKALVEKYQEQIRTVIQKSGQVTQ